MYTNNRKEVNGILKQLAKRKIKDFSEYNGAATDFIFLRKTVYCVLYYSTT